MQKLSSNQVHAQNIAILTAVAHVGGTAIMEAAGNDDAASTLGGEYYQLKDFQAGLIGRFIKYLGQ